MPKIFLYAEILTHIRQLTLYASLQTEKREGTQIDISSDKKIITVVHDGESQSLYLPTQISGNAQVTFPVQQKGTDISTRLQIDDLEEWNDPNAKGIETPWQASELSESTAIQCRLCKSTILQPGSIIEWKSLPSENWAELMDFWFCHKPHEEEVGNDEEVHSAQDFSSRNKLAVARGLGFTSLVSFVLHPDDCTNIKVAEAQESHRSVTVRCSSCTAVIGSTNTLENLIHIDKSSTAVQVAQESDTEQFPPSIFVCAQILSIIESTAIRKIVVHGHDAITTSETEKPTPGLLLWIFNPDIYYSSSAHPSARTENPLPASIVHRAAKVFYKIVPDPVNYLSENANNIEELVLPTNRIVLALRETLEGSTAMLPHSARRFQDWDVGLLDRYESRATGQVVMDQNPLSRKGDGPPLKIDMPAGFEALYT